MLTATFTSN